MSIVTKLLIILITSLISLNPSSSLANSPPQLVSPQNGSSVTSNKLEWQTPSYNLYPTSPYRVQVDEGTSFSDPFRDYYTKNTYYSPTLSPGTWYWRVKAKDDQGIWSDWSEVWSFNYSSTQTPAPTPLDPTPSPFETNSPSPTSSDSPANEFLVSEVPENINSDQNFTVRVDLLLSKYSDSNFYLKGAFIKEGESNYFGLTKVGSIWIKNSTTFSSQKLITTDSGGKWAGELGVMVDEEDSGFKENGAYIFKVARYTSSGSGPTWSNQSSINIKNVAKTLDEETETSSPTSKPLSSQTPSTKKSENTQESSKVSSNKNLANASLIAGVATYSATTLATPQTIAVKGQASPNWLLIIAGLITLIIGAGSFVFFLKRH